MHLIFDPVFEKECLAGRTIKVGNSFCAKHRSVSNIAESTWPYNNVRNSAMDQTSITYSIAPNCLLQSIQLPEAGELVYMRCPFENRKVMQGPSDSESDRIFGIACRIAQREAGMEAAFVKSINGRPGPEAGLSYVDG